LFRPLRISAPPLQVIQIARITVDSAVSIAWLYINTFTSRSWNFQPRSVKCCKI
jgi:hypothetical protein